MDKNQIDKIILYGTSWCGDCFNSRHLMDDMGIEYVEINIDQNEQAAEKVVKLNNGFRSVPTIVFPDGSILVEPSNMELAKKLENYKNL